MNEYDEVELMVDQPQWGLLAGARGAVVDVGSGDDVVAVEFYQPDEENIVHLVSSHLLRVTDHYAPSVLVKTTAPQR